MSKFVILALIVLVIIIVAYKMKTKQPGHAVIPVDKLDVEKLAKQFENDLQVENISIENVSETELESTTDAIIADLATEAEESLPESLNPNVSDLAIPENDKLQLETLLSGDSLVLGVMRSLGIARPLRISRARPLGLTPSPLENAQNLPPPPSILETAQNLVPPPPVDVTELIRTPVAETETEIQEEKPTISNVAELPPKPETQEQQKVLENLKEKVIVEEVEKINQQEQFINSQVKNVEGELNKLQAEEGKELRSLEQDLQNNPVQKEQLVQRTQQVKEEAEERKIQLTEKLDGLKALSEEKKKLSNDVSSHKITTKRVKKLKLPRKSKKGRVRHAEKKLASGGSSFTLNVPSDLNPEEFDEIDISISKESSEILEKYEIIKSKIVRDKSLANISDEEKTIIKSAGREFKKIKSDYVNKRTEKVRSRKNKIKARKLPNKI